MGLRAEERVIGEFTYRVRQHGYREGRALLPIVLRCIGPTLGTLLEGLGSGGKSGGLEANLDLSAALSEFSASLNEEDLAHITDKLAERSWIVGGREHRLAHDTNGDSPLSSVQEEHWPSRYSDWLKWLAFALEVNFSSFLGGKASVVDTLSAMSKGVSASKSPSTSTGDSGQSSAPG